MLTQQHTNNKNEQKIYQNRVRRCKTTFALHWYLFIQNFQGGGIEIISDILSDRSNPEPQMREAITVLTQITAPWLTGHYDLTQLHLYLNSIVGHITGKFDFFITWLLFYVSLDNLRIYIKQGEAAT